MNSELNHHTCDTCVHEGDSGSEYCGSCDLIDNWSESASAIEERIGKRQRELEALCRQLVNRAEYLAGIAESIGVSDTQTMRDKLARAIGGVNAAIALAKKGLGVNP